jgi:hypothetical protein
MSSLSLRDIQGISAFQNKVRIPSGHQLSFDGNLKIPTWTTGTRPASPEIGLFGFNTTDGVTELYNGTEWVTVGQSRLDGSSEQRAAISASTLRQTLGSSAVNGAYWYKFSDGSTRRLWTDFTTYSNYSFVMVTRIWSGSQNQYLTTEENVTDLSTIPSNTAPTRHSKLSDAYMNEIIVPNSIRWAIVGNGSTFYRLDDSPQWFSNHGASQSCSYNTGFYSGYATPSNTPNWIANGSFQACGGSYDVSGAWLSLTGIHTNDGVYFGGYSGGSGARATPPSPYSVGGVSNDTWSQNGYVLLNW